MGYSKDNKTCQKCPCYHDCDEKKMAACAYMSQSAEFNLQETAMDVEASLLLTGKMIKNEEFEKQLFAAITGNAFMIGGA